MENADIERLAYQVLRFTKVAEDRKKTAEQKKVSAQLARERWIQTRTDAALFSALPLILIATVWPHSHAVALAVMALLGLAAIGMKILGSLIVRE